MKSDTVEVIKVHSGRYNYFIKVITQYSHRPPHAHVSYSFDIGGKMKGCIRITVRVPSTQVQDERFAFLEETKRIAHVSWIGYSPKCSISSDLSSGEGTKHMVRTAFTFVMNMCPWVEKFSLTDKSKVPCVEGMKVSLPHMSIATNGKTYYEKYFGAYLENTGMRKINEELTGTFSDADKKMDWHDFCDTCRFSTDTEKLLKPIYNSAKTYMTFFRDLRTLCEKDKVPFCKVIYPWVDKFIDEVLVNRRHNFFGQSWIIDKDKIVLTTISRTDTCNAEMVLADLQEQFKEYEVFRGGACSACLGPNDF